MKKERACRAHGGAANSRKNVIKSFHGANEDNEPDDALEGGPLKRKRGGKVEMKVDGDGHKPHGGRAMRKRGGRAGGGSALHPLADAGGSGPKGVHKMPDSERSP